MDEQIAQQLKEAEAAVAEAERAFGADSAELADKLSKLAALMRQAEKRALDIANVEARAKAIRAKLYAAQEETHKTTVSVTKPNLKNQGVNPGMYLGFAAIFLSLGTLFITQSLFKFVAPVAIVLAIGDVVLTRGGLWRIALTVLFVGSAWYSIQSVPANVLTDATPLDRFNYASQNGDLVEQVKQLGKPVPVLSYTICLPEGFNGPVDDTKDYGRTLTWSGPVRDDQTSPQLTVMVLKVPDDFKKRFNTYSPLKLAQDLAMPKVFEFLEAEETKVETPREEDINGFEFARIGFQAKINQERKGFVYVAKERRSLICIICLDSMVHGATSIEQMEASIYTLTKQAHGKDVDL